MKRDRQLLKEIQGVLETEERRTVAAERVAQLIRGRGAYRWVGIYAVEDDEIAALAWSGPQEPAHPRFPASKGLCGAAVRARTTVVVGDVVKDPRYLTTLASTQSEIVVPIVHPATRTALGVIDVESEQLNAFSDEDRQFLEECAAVLVRLYG